MSNFEEAQRLEEQYNLLWATQMKSGGVSALVAMINPFHPTGTAARQAFVAKSEKTPAASRNERAISRSPFLDIASDERKILTARG